MEKVKILMQLAMVAIFIWKVYEAVASYMNPPTGWQTRVVEDKDFHLPGWTLCASGLPHPALKQKFAAVTNSSTMTAAYNGMPEIDDIIYKLKMGDKDLTSDIKTYFKYKFLVNNAYNFFFGCYTFNTPKEFSYTGFQKGIRAFVKFAHYSMLLSVVHNNGTGFMSYSEIMGLKPIIIMNSPMWYDGFTKFDSFVMKRTMMEKLSTDDEPCVDQESYDDFDDGLQACFMRYVENTMGCNLPWTGVADAKGVGKKSRVCDKEEEYEKFKKLNDDVMAMGVAEVRKNLGCKIPCSYFVYGIEKNADSWYPSITAQTGNEFLIGAQNITHIDISVADRFYEEKKEIILYTGNHLIADIGGYLGLLLGISIINLYEMAIEHGGSIWRNFNKHTI